MSRVGRRATEDVFFIPFNLNPNCVPIVLLSLMSCKWPPRSIQFLPPLISSPSSLHFTVLPEKVILPDFIYFMARRLEWTLAIWTTNYATANLPFLLLSSRFELKDRKPLGGGGPRRCIRHPYYYYCRPARRLSSGPSVTLSRFKLIDGRCWLPSSFGVV